MALIMIHKAFIITNGLSLWKMKYLMELSKLLYGVWIPIYCFTLVNVFADKVTVISTGTDFCCLEEGVDRPVMIDGKLFKVIVKYNTDPEGSVSVGLDFMAPGEKWTYENEHSMDTDIIMVNDTEKATLAALQPLMQDIVVDSDLEIRMQQDDSINPSVIHTILLDDLTESDYTFTNRIQDNTYLAISDDKLQLQCLSNGGTNLCGNVGLHLPEINNFTPKLVFSGATFRPENSDSNRYTWSATKYRLMGKMAACGRLEIIDHHMGSCINTILANDMTKAVDLNSSTCLSPFVSGRRVFHMNLLVTSRCGALKVAVITNVDCHEPYTVLGSMGNNTITFNQCTLSSETAYGSPAANRCVFACSCLEVCDRILIQQNFLPWRDNDPNKYQTCDVRIVQEP